MNGEHRTLPGVEELPSAPPGRTGWPWTAGDAAGAESSHLDSGGSWPRITVVTPSYNQGEYLEETIRSVLLQGYPNLEYFVIDGGSSDDSAAIIARYEPWLSGWVTETDDGQTHAILKGFGQATGDLLGWINSDDRLAPSALTAVARSCNGHPEAGLVHAKCSFIDAGGQPLPSHAGREFDLVETIRGNNCVAQSSAFFRREAYERVGGLDVTLHYIMDMDLWLRLGLAADVVFVDECWSQFRRHDASKTGQGDLAFAREIYIQAGRAFDELELPAVVLGDRNRVLANLGLRLGYRYHQVGEDREARRYALRAAWQHLPAVLSPGGFGTFARTLLGRGLIGALKRGRAD